MKVVTNVSGGKSSAYIAANYPSDYLVFALVRTNDKDLEYKDSFLKKWTEEKIQTEFVGTLEDDAIIQTMYDLEQFLGKQINFVTSDKTFDELIDKERYLPNMFRRFCTKELKVIPIFEWWRKEINEVIITNVGYRANETMRAKRMIEKLNKDGLLVEKSIIGQSKNGRNKWGEIAWEKPQFPLIKDGIYRDEIISFWENKPVRFAEFNNCQGCFHSKTSRLRYLYDKNPAKINWFAKQENKFDDNIFFKKDFRYRDIEKVKLNQSLFDRDNGCDSGYCGY